MTDTIPLRLLVHLAFTASVGAVYLVIGRLDFSSNGVLWSSVCELATQFTQLDRIVGFQPWWIWLYLSLWILWWIPVYCLSPSEYRLFITAAAVCYVIAFVCFLACPTGRARQSIEDFSLPLQLIYRLLYAIDPNRNVFPSLHAIIGALLIRMLWPKRYGGLLACWGGLVVCSSVLTKQHTIVDVIAGVLVAVIVLELCRMVGKRL